jgi:ABC-type taurine transport system ATPase subunit
VTELALTQASLGALLHAEGRFGPGRSVVLGDDSRALSVLAAVASGSEAPERGRALLNGVPLDASPAARRHTASLLADEVLPPAHTVEEAVTRILAARASRRTANEALGAFGLSRWNARRASELDWDERRSLGLALALAHESARLLVLYEPLGTSSVPASTVHAELERAIAGGATVLLLTTSVESALAFGGPTVWLERGVLRGTPLAAQLEAVTAPEMAARPANQVVSMPTAFADPASPRNEGGGS